MAFLLFLLHLPSASKQLSTDARSRFFATLYTYDLPAMYSAYDSVMAFWILRKKEKKKEKEEKKDKE